ncbi:MAG: cobalamin biosynthesis protein CbiG [Pseudomonadota bacterium]
MSDAGALFDVYVIADWSAAGAPKRGADSIWIAAARRARGAAPRLVALLNPATRAEAETALRETLQSALGRGERALLGFDFPFGYPAGAAARLLGEDAAPAEDEPLWARLWAKLAREVRDGPRNATNRYAAAGALNAGWAAPGPFWGNGAKAEIDGLGRRKPSGYGAALPAEFRLVERRLRAAGGPRPKSVWQLAGAGSVGGQALTGLPVVERLRRDPRLATSCRVWPFETGFAPPAAPIAMAEIYPSLIPVTPAAGEPKDAAQVRTLALALGALDAKGALSPLFSAAEDLTAAERAASIDEEGWILGAHHAAALQEAS